MLTLRDYQRESVDAVYAYWQKGGGNPLIVLPTGAGKSLVLATIVRELCEQWPDLRIAVVTHVKELINQDYQALMRIWPEAPAGIYSAGLNRRDTRSRVLFCGVQSVWNKVARIGHVDVLIVDEAHLIPKSADTTYGKFIAALREETPDMRVVGLTATPYRLDSGRLDRGKDRIFDSIAYEASVSDLIDEGFLSPLISKATLTKLDVTGVGKRGGDFIPGQLDKAVNKPSVTASAVEEIVRLGADRRAWIAFCVTVDHAEAIRDEIRQHGILCETVTGETPKGDRDRIISAFRAGQIRCLTSVGVLTTGFDVPAVDLVALLRPTQSAGLYVQSVGRAFRLAPGKANALVLDFAGNVRRHGPVNRVEVKDKSTGGAAAKDDEVKAKECPVCQSLVWPNTRTCPCCGHEWVVDSEPKHEASADATVEIISRARAPEWITVDSVRYYRHEKVGSPPSMRVEYHCGMTVHREWICFEHQGYARSKAETWWLRTASGFSKYPKTTTEALDRVSELRTPAEIRVTNDGKYTSVTARKFPPMEQAA